MAKRRSPGTSASPAKKKRRSAVTPPRGDEKLVAEGRSIQAALKKYFAQARKRKPKICPAPLQKDFTRDLRAATTAIAAHALGKDSTRAATKAKDALLRALLVEIRSILADIVAAYGDTDPSLCSAFGRGKSAKTAQQAVAVASEQQQAFESETFGALARNAGIDKKRIDHLVAARQAVARGITAQGTAGAEKVGQRIEKGALVRQLRTRVRQVRRIAQAAFSHEPQILKAFAIVPAGRKKGSRNKKPPPTAPGSVSATA